MRFQASGWHTLEADGHDPASVRAALNGGTGRDSEADDDRGDKRRSAMARRTRPGHQACMDHRSAPMKLRRPARNWAGPMRRLRYRGHSGVLGGLPARRGADAYATWALQWSKVDPAQRAAFENPMNETIFGRRSSKRCARTRRPSSIRVRRRQRGFGRSIAIEALLPVVPGLVGGSADLTGSNNTLGKGQPAGCARRIWRQLHSFRCPRTCDGCCHERTCALWRVYSVRRHVPGVYRLLPSVDPAIGADGAARNLRHDTRFDRAW